MKFDDGKRSSVPLDDAKDSNETLLISKNPFSRFFFHYARKVMRRGRAKAFEEADLFRLDDFLLYEAHFKSFNDFRNAHPDYSYQRSFSKWIFKHSSFYLIGQVLINLIIVGNPFIIKEFINWFLNPAAQPYQGYVLCAILLGIALCRALVNQHSILQSYKATLFVLVLVFGSYFQKFQGISIRASKALSIGSVLTSITSDSTKITIFLMTYANIFVGPLIMIVYSGVLCFEIGWAALVGMLVILTIMTLQLRFGRKMGSIAKEKSACLDQRNKQISSTLMGIKTIKLNGWEKIIGRMIDDIRLNEVRLASKSTFIRGILEAFSFIAPLLASLTSIMVYQAVYGKLSLGSIFFIITLFNMTMIPLRVFFYAMITLFEAKVGLTRIAKFCGLPQQESEDSILTNDENLPCGTLVISNVTSSHRNEEEKDQAMIENEGKASKTRDGTTDTNVERKERAIEDSNPKPCLNVNKESSISLRNILLTFEPNQFVAVVGNVGSGKSTLLKTILGELYCEQGEIRKNGRIAYVPQESFLMNGQLRENITFGSAFDQERYQKVIAACELLPDLAILADGDLTEIGERGVNLSGGQKQRISIARAVYAEADIFLIDDCLSAVDVHVGQALFQNVFRGMLQNKTIIMTTNALQHLPKVDRIVMLENGSIVADGTYKDLKQTNPKFTEFIKQNEQKQNSNKHTIPGVSFTKREAFLSCWSKPSNLTTTDSGNLCLKGDGTKVVENDEELANLVSRDPTEADSNKQSNNGISGKRGQFTEIANVHTKTGQLTKLESRFTGHIGVSLYYNFFKKGNLWLFTICILFFAAAIMGRIVADWWVAAWSTDYFKHLTFRQSLLIYSGIASATFVILMFRSYLWAAYMAKISYKLFADLFKLIMGKQMSFFDTTPAGQIINLTSKDTDLVDLYLPGTYVSFLSNFLQIVGIFLLIAMSNVMLIPVLLIFLASNGVLISKYLRVSMELRRMEQIAYSPILSNIMELFNGISVYRTFGKTAYQEKIYTRNVNKLITITFHDRVVTTYTNFLTEVIMALLLGATFFLLCFAKTHEISYAAFDPNFVALTVSWMLTIPLLIQSTMFMFSETAKGMCSVQRLMSNVDQDNKEKVQGNVELPSNWPSRGEIRAVNVSARYRPSMPLVVRNVNFQIRSNEKIGIVGRTGSGKSTMAMLLTRLLELENENEGFIEIDGFKIHEVNLDVLRSSITVIPQDPYILKGTLRSNVDPFNKHSDERVIEVLKKSLLWHQPISTSQTQSTNQDAIGNHQLQAEHTFSRKTKLSNSKNCTKTSSKQFQKASNENTHQNARTMIKTFKGCDKENIPMKSTYEGKSEQLIGYNLRELGDIRTPVLTVKEVCAKDYDHANVLTNEKSFANHGSTLVTNIDPVVTKDAMDMNSQSPSFSKADHLSKTLVQIGSSNPLSILKFEIEDNGNNISAGQKQLICIARALLDVPKILIMDEATSHIDQKTDFKIQKVVQSEFSDTTIITIAHRLNTILDYDRILVMENGEIVEEGSPSFLQANDTIFRDMLADMAENRDEKPSNGSSTKTLNLTEAADLK